MILPPLVTFVGVVPVEHLLPGRLLREQVLSVGYCWTTILRLWEPEVVRRTT